MDNIIDSGQLEKTLSAESEADELMAHEITVTVHERPEETEEDDD